MISEVVLRGGFEGGFERWFEGGLRVVLGGGLRGGLNHHLIRALSYLLKLH